MLEKYYNINQAIGVGIHVSADGSIQVDACRVTVENNQLSIDKKLTALESLEELRKHFPEKALVAFNLTGKGILQKQTEAINEINQHSFSQILPNAKAGDFYVQNFISGNHSFVSVIRKQEADRWITQFKSIGLPPLQMSLGPFPVQNIIQQLNVYDSGIIFNGHIIEVNEKQDWSSSKYEQGITALFPLKVESENLDEKLLIPYAAAFNLVMASKVQTIAADVPLLETEFASVIATKRLKAKSVMILSVFFVLLLINFIVFSWLNSANAKLSDQVGELTQTTINSQSTEDQIKQKEGLLNELGWDNGVSKSAMIDQLAALLPEEITLNEIAVNPIDVAASRIQKSLTFSNREIKISGISEKIIPVNEWIARVKTKSWVKSIQLDSYTFNSELNTGQFTIIINY